MQQRREAEGLEQQFIIKRSRARRSWRTLAPLGIVAACLALLVAGVFLARLTGSPSSRLANESFSSATVRLPPIDLRLPPPDLVRPLTPEEAVAENIKRAFSNRPDSPASSFRLAADLASRDRALECLTQAVYYEAASEGLDGGRAVAQVVLNRMRHPAYPSSICGVIYQGSARPTGCQFTFTCDGSLARPPAQSLWAQARRIASEALAGKVFAPVGHATHYHADYVVPYWADSLDKSVQVGRHIFYRLKGSLGSTGAFRQRYAGVEPVPPPPSSAAVALEAVAAAEQLIETPSLRTDPNLLAPTGELVATNQRKPDDLLVADELAGALILDNGAAPIKKVRPDSKPECSGADKGNRLRPLEANDIRAQGAGSAC